MSENVSKIIAYIDGDNLPVAGVAGIEKLDAADMVNIFYASGAPGNKAFSEEKKAAIVKRAKCDVNFHVIQKDSNAVDFAICTEVAKHFALTEEKDDIFLLISRDNHFDLIIRELHRAFNVKNKFLKVSSIEDGVSKYYLKRIDTLEKFNRYLVGQFGKESGNEIYFRISGLFKSQRTGQINKKKQTISFINLLKNVKKHIEEGLF